MISWMISHGGSAGEALFSALSGYSEAFFLYCLPHIFWRIFRYCSARFFLSGPAAQIQNNPSSSLSWEQEPQNTQLFRNKLCVKFKAVWIAVCKESRNSTPYILVFCRLKILLDDINIYKELPSCIICSRPTSTLVILQTSGNTSPIDL